MVGLLTLLGGFEYVRMFRKAGHDLPLVFLSLVILAFELDLTLDVGMWRLPLVTLSVLFVSLGILVQARGWVEQQGAVEQWGLTLAGGMYLGIGGGHLMALRLRPDGLWWVLMACGVVWVGDTAAYVIGRRWGRHKIAPSISPGKSWEGYAAQLVGGLGTGFLLAWLGSSLSAGDASLRAWYGLILGGVVSLLCPAGDFLISMMKRQVGVKDTGNLIPGHGGILDRMDSILWAGILGQLLAQLLGGSGV